RRGRQLLPPPARSRHGRAGLDRPGRRHRPRGHRPGSGDSFEGGAALGSRTGPRDPRRAWRPADPRQRPGRAGRAARGRASDPPAGGLAMSAAAVTSSGGAAGAAEVIQNHGWWLASCASGLVALVLVTISVFLGLTMAGKVMRRPGLSKKLMAAHEQTALAGLVAIAVHGIALLGDPWLHPGVAGVAVP